MREDRRAPEIIDAEFEVVGPRPPLLLFYTLPQAILVAVLVVVTVTFLAFGLFIAGGQADTACLALRDARTGNPAVLAPDFCEIRLSRWDAEHPPGR